MHTFISTARAQAQLGWRGAQCVAASGVNGNGNDYRGILGICEGAKEDKLGWSTFLKHLKEGTFEHPPLEPVSGAAQPKPNVRKTMDTTHHSERKGYTARLASLFATLTCKSVL
jgi:hypothetical protein